MSCCNNSGNQFAREISRFIGETVTIFTTSGGVSGCGFTGTILSVNSRFVRLVTHQGTPPANPLAENICSDMGTGSGKGGNLFDNIGYIGGQTSENYQRVGSVCDIPIDRIAAFNHNAV